MLLWSDCGCVTCREEGDAGIGPVLPHLVRQNSWDAPEVKVGGDPTGLDGHQVTTHSYRERKKI